MKIKWTNLFALCLGLFALVLVLKLPGPIASFLSTIREIGPGHDPEQQTRGLLAFGLVVVSLLALVRILVRTDRRDG